VVAHEFVPVLARSRLTVVTNPGFVYTRGDSYLEEVDERDVPSLYRCASLLDAGVTVAAGTDAPFGGADPWTAVRAAVSRSTRRGRTLGAPEAVPLATALGLFTGAATAPGHLRSVSVGQPGDLCLLADGAVPEPGQPNPVAATVVAGRVVHRAG
jgi:predicted amidohydrolase YtcJ